MLSKEREPIFSKFQRDQSGGFTMQAALMFCALAVLCTMLTVPVLDKLSQEYAESKSLGVDPITTASTSVTQAKGNKYIKRRSILSNQEEIICITKSGGAC